MRNSKRVWILLLSAAVLWLAVVWFVQRLVVFPRWAIAPVVVAELGPGVEVMRLETHAGAVEAWFIRGQGVSSEQPGPAVIFAHGNGELIDHWEVDLRGYTERGISVFLPEFRGYGRSKGRPSQSAIVADYCAFYDQLILRDEVDSARIVLHGRSIGGGVIAQLAAQRPSAALILQSSFTGTASLAASYLVPRFLVRDPLDVISVLNNYEQPVLIMHGERDQIIPPSHAQRNHAAARDSRLVLYPMGHNDPPPAKQYWDDVELFLREVGVIQ